VLFCHITSRIEGEKYGDLLSVMGGRGFPSMFWLDAEGAKVAEQGDRSIESFRETGAAITAVNKLAAKKDRTPAEDADYLLARINLGQLELEEAMAARKEMAKGPKEVLAKIDEALLVLEIKTKMESVTSQEEAAAAGKHFAQMIKDGRVPTKVGIPTAQFWLAASEYAYEEKDAELFGRCAKGVKDALENNSRYQGLYDQLDEKLAELKK